MTRNPAIAAVMEQERRGELWRQRVLGYPVWPLERLRRYRGELLQGALPERTGPGAPLRGRLQALAAPLRNSVADLQQGLARHWSGRDVWLLTSSMYRRPDDDGRMHCIYAHDLQQQLGARLLLLERTTNDLRLTPQDEVLPIDLLHIGAMMAGKALAPTAARAVRPQQAQAFAPLAPAYLAQLAIFGRLLEQATRRLLAAQRPRAVFVLCAYQPFIPIQRAVRAAGIPLIELQHGLVHDSHPGYALGEGYDDSHLPDHIVTFGKHWSSILDDASPHWRGRQSVGGHPWLRRKHRGSARRQRRVVALFSQIDPPVRSQLRQTALALRTALPQDLRVVIKPHPREVDSESYWGPLRAEGVELVERTADSYALLRDCLLSIAVFSTVAVEALAFGCRSVVMRSPLWTEDIRLLVDQGKILAADGADDVVRVLQSAPPEVDLSLADALFGVDSPPLDYERLIASLQP